MQTANSGFDSTAIADAVRRVCDRYDAAYWRACDEDGRFPEEFAADIVKGGWLGVAMPASAGGADLGLRGASVVMREVGRLGAAATSSIHVNLFGA